MAFMKVTCGYRNTGYPECAYAFCVTHGTCGGIYTGATVNRNERFGNIIDGLDCLITGHTHKGTVTRPSKIVIDMKNDIVSMKGYLQVSAVSWLNYGGYAGQKMLLPAESINTQKLVLSDSRNNKRISVEW